MAVGEDCDGDLILGDGGLVGDPVKVSLGEERAQSCAVGHDNPGALGRLAAGLPAEDDFPGNPWIGLHVPDIEGHIDDLPDLACLQVHRGEAHRAAAHAPRAKALA